MPVGINRKHIQKGMTIKTFHPMCSYIPRKSQIAGHLLTQIIDQL